MSVQVKDIVGRDAFKCKQAFEKFILYTKISYDMFGKKVKEFLAIHRDRNKLHAQSSRTEHNQYRNSEYMWKLMGLGLLEMHVSHSSNGKICTVKYSASSMLSITCNKEQQERIRNSKERRHCIICTREYTTITLLEVGQMESGWKTASNFSSDNFTTNGSYYLLYL